MDEVDIADFACGFNEVIAFFGPLSEDAEVFVVVEFGAGDHAWGNTFGVVVEVVGYFFDAIGADDGTAAGGLDVCEEREDEEGLLGGVEVVCEEVAVGVPAGQVVWVGDAVVAGQGAEVYDEIVLCEDIVLVVVVLVSTSMFSASRGKIGWTPIRTIHE